MKYFSQRNKLKKKDQHEKEKNHDISFQHVHIRIKNDEVFPYKQRIKLKKPHKG